MINTTSVFLEILISGMMSIIWIFLVLNKIANPSIQLIERILKFIQYPNVSIAFVFVILCYNLGWIIHYLSESVLDNLFQTRFRDKLFDSPNDFYKIRSEIFQKASEHTIIDLQFDRQVIRISRSNIFNLFLISVCIIPYFNRTNNIALLCFFISTIFCIASFFQWQNRYKSTFYEMRRIYETINQH